MKQHTGPWYEGPLLGFDTESTGTDPEEARLVTAYAEITWPGEEPSFVLDLLVDADGLEIPEGATAVHGVTTERAHQQGMNEGAAATIIWATIQWAWAMDIPVVAYNAPYDLTLLRAALRRAGQTGVLESMYGPIIDPLVIDKWANPRVKGAGQRQLTPTAGRYGIDLIDAHTASADVRAAVAIARAQGRWPVVQAVSLIELQAIQQEQAEAQAASLQRFFDSKGIREHVDGSWPIKGTGGENL